MLRKELACSVRLIDGQPFFLEYPTVFGLDALKNQSLIKALDRHLPAGRAHTACLIGGAKNGKKSGSNGCDIAPRR